jgi:hypothetical protein
MSAMTTIAAPTRRYPGAPTLHLFAGGAAPVRQQRRLAAARTANASDSELVGARRRGGERHRALPSGPAPDAPVLVAASDATRRDATIEELSHTMGRGTRFAHAAASWEVLALAGSSRMVILSGALEDVESSSLMRMLGHRYPALPVVSLDAECSLTAA